MPQTNYDLGELYKEVWGRAPFPLLISEFNSVSDISFFIKKKQSVNDIPSSESYAKESLPIVVLGYGEDYKSRFEFSVPPIISMRNKLNLTETPIIGQKGAVKENSSVSDYEIDVKGFLINEELERYNEDGYDYSIVKSEFPEEKLRELRFIFEAGKSLKVLEGVIFSIFNIEKILIKELDLPELEGYEGIIPFQLKCVSDFDIELEEI